MISPTDPLALGQAGEIDLCTVGSRVVFRCRPTDTLVIDINRSGVAWPTNAVVTIKRSGDGVNFNAHTAAITRTAIGMTDPFLAGAPLIAAEVTTLGTGTAPIPFDCRCEGGTLGVSP